MELQNMFYLMVMEMKTKKINKLKNINTIMPLTKVRKIKLIEHPKAVILDNNEISLAEYAKEYPKNWKKITKGLQNPETFDEGDTRVAPKGQFKANQSQREQKPVITEHKVSSDKGTKLSGTNNQTWRLMRLINPDRTESLFNYNPTQAPQVKEEVKTLSNLASGDTNQCGDKDSISEIPVAQDDTKPTKVREVVSSAEVNQSAESSINEQIAESKKEYCPICERYKCDCRCFKAGLEAGRKELNWCEGCYRLGKQTRQLAQMEEELGFLENYREYLLHFIQGERYESSAVEDLDERVEFLKNKIGEIEHE